jgi:RecA/RadA recombinase
MSKLNRSRSCPVAGERRLQTEQATDEKEEGLSRSMKLAASQTAWDLLQQSRQAQAPLYLIESTTPPPPPWLRLEGIVELVGAAGTGKTQIALSLCRQAVRDGAQAIYLAVGGGLGPALSRLRRMSDSNMLSRIWVRPVAHVEEWQALLLELPNRLATCRVLILDDLARLVRTLDDGDDHALRAALLFAWARTLRQWTVQFPHLVLVVVNQVVASDDTVRPACGLSWAHCVNSSYWVERVEEANATAFRRFLSLRKSSTYGMNRVEFRIEAQGVCLQDVENEKHSEIGES